MPLSPRVPFASPLQRTEDGDFLDCLQKLDLQAGRTMRWQAEAGKAEYPEEAMDELAMWAPGARHRIQMVCRNAREPRIESLGRQPADGSGHWRRWRCRAAWRTSTGCSRRFAWREP